MHGFKTDNERMGRFEDLKLKMECKKKDNICKSLWKFNERLKECVKFKMDSSMKFVQYCHMKKSIETYYEANDVILD